MAAAATYESEQARGWKYEPLASQRAFHADLTSQYKGFSGPIGSGKSRALVYEALFLAALNPGLQGLLGAPTIPMLRDSTLRAMWEVLEDEEIRYLYHAQANIIELPGPPFFGSEMLLRSLDDFERLRGPNLAWFGIDELTYCKPEVWTRLIGRVRHPKANRRCGFAVWTPKGFDWVYRDFVGPKRLPGYRAVLASPKENVYLPADYYANLARTYDPKFAEQELEGKYLSMQAGQVYYAFDRKLHLVPQKYSPTLPLCWSMDFNVDPMASVICQIDGKTVRVLEEVVLPDSNTEKACEEFWRRVEPWLKLAPGQRRIGPAPLRVYGDAAGGARSTAGKSDYVIVKEFFRRHAEVHVTYHVPAANPPVKDRVNAMNAKLKSATGLVGMWIDPRCEQLTEDLEQVTWKVDANKVPTGDIDKSRKNLTHVSDALGYLVTREFSLTGAPQLFGAESVGSKSGGRNMEFERPSGWRGM